MQLDSKYEFENIWIERHNFLNSKSGSPSLPFPGLEAGEVLTNIWQALDIINTYLCNFEYPVDIIPLCSSLENTRNDWQVQIFNMLKTQVKCKSMISDTVSFNLVSESFSKDLHSPHLPYAKIRTLISWKTWKSRSHVGKGTSTVNLKLSYSCFHNVLLIQIVSWRQISENDVRITLFNPRHLSFINSAYLYER